MLHHTLRIRRQWKCPRCGRSVLTRGDITARQCTCADPAPFMQLVDTPRVMAFDSSQFATYTSPEYATPTEAELVEDLPAHLVRPPVERSSEPPKPRRGKGYLRAEISETDSSEDDSLESPAADPPEDDFGSGVEAEEQPEKHFQHAADQVIVAKSSGHSGTEDAENTEDAADPSDPGAESPGRRRKRRRRRGRRGSGNAEVGSDSESATETQRSDSVAAARPHDSVPTPEGASHAPQSEKTGRKRRRRRRDRRGKSE